MEHDDDISTPRTTRTGDRKVELYMGRFGMIQCKIVNAIDVVVHWEKPEYVMTAKARLRSEVFFDRL